MIVTTNLFGDILSDLCAQMVGGMGFAYSGNIGETYAVFEPTHGSAPKYAGHEQGEPDSHHPGRQDDGGMARRDTRLRAASRGPWRMWSSAARCGPTTWAARRERRRWRGRWRNR